jgi:membrane protease YdiL (CAAX protease family)
MTFSIAIIASVLAYTWLLQPIAPRWTAALVAAIVIAVALARAALAREWGVAPSHFAPSLLLAAVFTAAATGVLVAAGSSRHRWHTPSLTAADAGFLLLWALGQQFALQITLLREAQTSTTRAAGVVVASILFAALHLPNPFLTGVTLIAALAWCAIYSRHPNLIPLTLSHALLTVVVLSALDDTMTGRLRVGAAYVGLR